MISTRRASVMGVCSRPPCLVSLDLRSCPHVWQALSCGRDPSTPSPASCCHRLEHVGPREQVVTGTGGGGSSACSTGGTEVPRRHIHLSSKDPQDKFLLIQFQERIFFSLDVRVSLMKLGNRIHAAVGVSLSVLAARKGPAKENAQLLQLRSPRLSLLETLPLHAFF